MVLIFKSANDNNSEEEIIILSIALFFKMSILILHDEIKSVNFYTLKSII